MQGRGGGVRKDALHSGLSTFGCGNKMARKAKNKEEKSRKLLFFSVNQLPSLDYWKHDTL